MKVMNGSMEVDAAWIVPDDIRDRVQRAWMGAMGEKPGIVHAYVDVRPADDGSALLLLPPPSSWGSTGMSAPLSNSTGIFG